jgi:hypothetical protein
LFDEITNKGFEEIKELIKEIKWKKLKRI